jgi:hypothetical protein
VSKVLDQYDQAANLGFLSNTMLNLEYQVNLLLGDGLTGDDLLSAVITQGVKTYANRVNTLVEWNVFMFKSNDQQWPVWCLNCFLIADSQQNLVFFYTNTTFVQKVQSDKQKIIKEAMVNLTSIQQA